MTGVVAYAVLVTAVAAILCCHHGEHGRATGRTLLDALRRTRQEPS
ncbi:hypothetical protein ACGFNQ_02525 [Streptomyces asoensis]|nr:hypothetical protein [Streptomyces sp. MBT97]MBK3631593.1 hypothetical protein [Streptomyces sp. MBT97]